MKSLSMTFAMVLATASPMLAGARAADIRPGTRVAELVRKLNDTSAAPRVLVIAHRTCWWGAAPENSLSGIRNCIAMAPDGIEIDTVRTKDGQLVAMHDLTVDRMTNGTGKVKDMTLAEIKALRLRALQGGRDAPLTDEHVPSLEEALRLARPYLLVHIHDKEPGLEADIAKLVDRLHMKDQVTVWYNGLPDSPRLISSPLNGHVRAINTINQCGGQVTKGCLASPVTDLMAYARFRPVAFNVNAQDHDFLRQVAAAKRPAGARVAGNTLYGFDFGPMDKLQAEWNAQLDAGASLILTNRPRELLELVRQRETAQ